MPSPLLYSTNVYLKLHIQQCFRGDIHYVWCSEFFDSKTLGRYSPGSLIPPSSNPADIYRQLKSDIERGDQHSSKIAEQKASLTKLAIAWERNGEISPLQRAEIVYMVKNASFNDWRPLVYIIPRQPVDPRVKLVPANKRAGLGMEYIIEDLKRSEFDLIEI